MRSIIFLILSVASNAFASEYSTQCNQFPKPLPGGYCIHTPQSHFSGDFVYHLHGNGGSEKHWQDPFYYPEQIRAYWSQTNAPLPIVVSFSFGSTWLLVEKNSLPTSGLLEVVVEKIIPLVEAQLGGLKGRRLLIGESMGGFNTAQLSLKTNLFAKAAILCAPMSPVSPFGPIEDLKNYAKSTVAYEYYKKHDPDAVINAAVGMVSIVEAFMTDEEEWQRANPLALAKTSQSSTAIYAAVGYYDEYSAYEGNILFTQALQQAGRSVEWRPQWGGHCAMDIPSLSQFLVN